MAKESRALHKQGDGYIVIDLTANEIAEEVADLEAYARKTGCLKPFEELKP